MMGSVETPHWLHHPHRPTVCNLIQ